MKVIDLAGRRLGRLVVTRRAANDESGRTMWECDCDCGNTKVIAGQNLRDKRPNRGTRSCGCLFREAICTNWKGKFGENHGRWKGGVNNRGSLPWCRRVIRQSESAARKYGGEPLKCKVEELYRWLAEEPKRCAICGDERLSDLHIDHCHSSGEIRGLLCQHCNHLLGMARDSTVALLNAIEYLEKPSVQL